MLDYILIVDAGTCLHMYVRVYVCSTQAASGLGNGIVGMWMWASAGVRQQGSKVAVLVGDSYSVYCRCDSNRFDEEQWHHYLTYTTIANVTHQVNAPHIFQRSQISISCLQMSYHLSHLWSIRYQDSPFPRLSRAPRLQGVQTVRVTTLQDVLAFSHSTTLQGWARHR